MRPRVIAASAAAIAAALLASACQQLFTSSVAPYMARDNLVVSVGSASDIEAAKPLLLEDSALALAALDDVVTVAAAAGTGAQVSAVEIAISASGISDTITGLLADFDIVGGVTPTQAELAAILADITSDGSVALALDFLSDPAVLAAAEPADLVIAGVLLGLQAIADAGETVASPAVDIQAAIDANPLVQDVLDAGLAGLAAGGGDTSIADLIAGFLGV